MPSGWVVPRRSRPVGAIVGLVRDIYRAFESLSLRQLAQGCVFSGQTRAQLGPVTAVIFYLGSGLPIDRAGILFSGRPFLSEALDSTHSVRFFNN
jgi:hypothetical protein